MRKRYFQLFVIVITMFVGQMELIFAEENRSPTPLYTAYIPRGHQIFDIYWKNGTIDKLLLTTQLKGINPTLLDMSLLPLEDNRRSNESYISSSSEKYQTKINAVSRIKTGLFSGDGSRVTLIDLPYCTEDENIKTSIHVLDAKTASRLHVIDLGGLDTDAFRSVAISPDGTLIAVAIYNQPTRIWELKGPFLDKTPQSSMHELYWSQNTEIVQFSPSGKQVATAGSNGVVRLWDAKKGTFLRSIRLEDRSIRTLAFSNDGNQIAMLNDKGRIAVWNIISGQIIKTSAKEVTNFVGAKMGLAFSPDGSQLATWTYNKIFFWNTKTGVLEKKIDPPGDHIPNKILFSPGGQKIIGVYDYDIQILDVKNGKWLYELNSLQG